MDDNLSSPVTVASKYVLQIAAELGCGVFPPDYQHGLAAVRHLPGLSLPIGWPAITPACTTQVCTIIGQEKETSYRFMVAILSRSVGGYMRGMVVTSICA